MDGDRQLPATQGQLITQQSEPRSAGELCSKGLLKLLTEGDDAGGACRLISLNATLRAECERVLPMLMEAREPAPENEVLEILVRHAPAYNVAVPAGGNWSYLFGPYLDALEGLPAYAIEDAFLRWNRGEGHANLQMASFYPKSAQLVMLAQKGKATLYMASYRAKKALEYVDKTAPRQIPEEERRKVADALRELSQTMRSKPMPHDFPPRVSPQEMAARIRAAAPDDGDVI